MSLWPNQEFKVQKLTEGHRSWKEHAREQMNTQQARRHEKIIGVAKKIFLPGANFLGGRGWIFAENFTIVFSLT